MQDRIALNSWTLQSTNLFDLLAIAKRTGYAAVELRMADFKDLPAPDEAIAAINASGLKVTSLGADGILVQADADAQTQWFERLDVAAGIAERIGCDTIMVSTGMENATTVEVAASFLVQAAQALKRHEIRLAYEFNAFHPSLNTLSHAVAVLGAAPQADIGLALDSYHMQQSRSWDGLSDIPSERLFCVQLSDVPTAGGQERAPLDRLMPGRGTIDWGMLFRFLDRCGYRAPVSFEAPNPATWRLDAAQVARDGLLSIADLWRASTRS